MHVATEGGAAAIAHPSQSFDAFPVAIPRAGWRTIPDLLTYPPLSYPPVLRWLRGVLAGLCR